MLPRRATSNVALPEDNAGHKVMTRGIFFAG